jgi:S-adenosylmethionine-dependent methyltransferase
MAESRRPRSIPATLLRELIAEQLQAHPHVEQGLDVVDVGGGTGVLATELAGQGHRVTVVDPSPDALASLQRRSTDAGLGDRIVAVQGDAADLADVVGPEAADVVICHRVLEVVDSAPAALAGIAAVLRPAGLLSLLVVQRPATVLAQALLGHVEQARRTYAAAGLDRDQILALLAGVGFLVKQEHGLGAVADHVPESAIDADIGSYETLLALEREISTDPAFRAIAPQLHVLAARG